MRARARPGWWGSRPSSYSAGAKQHGWRQTCVIRRHIPLGWRQTCGMKCWCRGCGVHSLEIRPTGPQWRYPRPGMRPSGPRMSESRSGATRPDRKLKFEHFRICICCSPDERRAMAKNRTLDDVSSVSHCSGSACHRAYGRVITSKVGECCPFVAAIVMQPST
jgi:hypothetical protein